jgi:hypothetical protein
MICDAICGRSPPMASQIIHLCAAGALLRVIHRRLMQEQNSIEIIQRQELVEKLLTGKLDSVYGGLVYLWQCQQGPFL